MTPPPFPSSATLLEDGRTYCQGQAEIETERVFTFLAICHRLLEYKLREKRHGSFSFSSLCTTGWAKVQSGRKTAPCGAKPVTLLNSWTVNLSKVLALTIRLSPFCLEGQSNLKLPTSPQDAVNNRGKKSLLPGTPQRVMCM